MKEPGKAQNQDRRQICLGEEEERFKERLKELKAGLNGGRRRGGWRGGNGRWGDRGERGEVEKGRVDGRMMRKTGGHDGENEVVEKQ